MLLIDSRDEIGKGKSDDAVSALAESVRPKKALGLRPYIIVMVQDLKRSMALPFVSGNHDVYSWRFSGYNAAQAASHQIPRT